MSNGSGNELVVPFGPGTVKIVAPSVDVTVLAGNNHPIQCTGTSFSAPMVTGTLGLLLAQTPSLRGNPAALGSRRTGRFLRAHD